jgi:hypothetical protein
MRMLRDVCRSRCQGVATDTDITDTEASKTLIRCPLTLTGSMTALSRVCVGGGLLSEPRANIIPTPALVNLD